MFIFKQDKIFDRIVVLHLSFIALAFYLNVMSINSVYAYEIARTVEAEEDIDQWLEEETEKSYSRADMLKATGVAWDKWRNRLNVRCDELQAHLTKEEKILFEDAQQKWIEYEEAEKELLEVVRPPEGTYFLSLILDIKMGITSGRAYELQHLRTDIVKSSPTRNPVSDDLTGQYLIEAEEEIKILCDDFIPLIKDRKFRGDGDYYQRETERQVLYDSQQKWIVLQDAQYMFLEALYRRGILSEGALVDSKFRCTSSRAFDLMMAIELAKIIEETY